MLVHGVAHTTFAHTKTVFEAFFEQFPPQLHSTEYTFLAALTSDNVCFSLSSVVHFVRPASCRVDHQSRPTCGARFRFSCEQASNIRGSLFTVIRRCDDTSSLAAQLTCCNTAVTCTTGRVNITLLCCSSSKSHGLQFALVGCSC